MKRPLWLLAAAAAWITGCGLMFSATQHTGIISGIYWAMVTATTVGYGDVTPKGTGGQLLAMGVMLTSIPLLGAVWALAATAHMSGKIRAHVDARLAEHHQAIHDRLDRFEERTAAQSMNATPGRAVPFRAGGVTPSTVIPPLVSGPSVLLADISEFQPQIADAIYLAWSKAVVIRALYGDAHDDAAWYGGQRRGDLHKGGAQFLGIYQYLVAGQSGAAQAQAFRDLVGPIRPGELFIADDEEGDHELLTAWYNKMIALYGTGIRPYLWTYTGLWFGEQTGILPVQWIADYSAAEPSTPHKLWQFSESYPVPGVGVCDCSLFHGTIGELAALAYQVPKPAGWTFPAPAGLHLVKKTGDGYTLAWDAVKGPSGQKPASYSVYTYRGAAVVNHQTVSGLTASEYGPGGKGLPAGTYETRVWANGAPDAPPHASLTVQLAR